MLKVLNEWMQDWSRVMMIFAISAHNLEETITITIKKNKCSKDTIEDKSTNLLLDRISSIVTDVSDKSFGAPPHPNKNPLFFLYRTSTELISAKLLSKTTTLEWGIPALKDSPELQNHIL